MRTLLNALRNLLKGLVEKEEDIIAEDPSEKVAIPIEHNEPELIPPMPNPLPHTASILQRVGYDLERIPVELTASGSSRFSEVHLRMTISRMQLALGITVDGDAGSKTELAVQGFEERAPSSMKDAKGNLKIWNGKPHDERSFGNNRPWWFGHESWGDDPNTIQTDYTVTFTTDQLRLAKLIVRNNRRFISDEYNSDMRKLIYACIMTESSGKKGVTRHEPHLDDYSYGLMQILSGTADSLGFTGEPADLLDPATNIEWGARLIVRQRYKNLGDPVLTAIAYNAGGVYASGSSPWGMRAYGPYERNHADKFISNYNAIIQAAADGYNI